MGNGTRGPMAHNLLHSMVPRADDLAIVVEEIRAVIFPQWMQASIRPGHDADTGLVAYPVVIYPVVGRIIRDGEIHLTEAIKYPAKSNQAVL